MCRILILGSCVSRDVFRVVDPNDFQIVDYYARTSLISLMSPQPISWNVDFRKISSRFQRKIVKRDLFKTFKKKIKHTQFDVLLIDFIDERFTVLQENIENGGIATLSCELAKGISEIETQNIKSIASNTDEFLILWEESWKEFVSFLNHNNLLSKVCVHKVFWATKLSDGMPFDFNYVQSQNIFLSRLYDRICLDLKEEQILELDMIHMIADPEHQWGKAPYHFVKEYYEGFYHLLNHFVKSIK